MSSSSPPPSSSSCCSDPVPPPWLKSLPLAPEFHPSPAEFADPIAYILRVEPLAAPYGICKIVPPYPSPSKKSTLSNLSRSFSSLLPPSPSPSTPTPTPGAPTFSTRQQQVGLCPRRPRPALKPVWHSGDRYTLPQFEAKAAAFRRSILSSLPSKRSSSSSAAAAQLSPLEIEALFWRANADRPITVEYANDMPGSGFSPAAGRLRSAAAGAPMNVGETAWNMRGVARAPGSLLRFMRQEIPGVTSPMVYVAMMFSWFAWHVEDHELHSLNYLHFGAGKTWYGVPRDAALAFEDVVRVHGYGGEVNPLATFAMLGEKTTVLSPEVLVGSGIPCCRLVQNAGEFVVTFPGSYHSGFSHGFNCAEASNIATPEWLKVAKEAAIRRASINHPPMVSHYQLLYELALSMCSRKPFGGGTEPRSSRLKDKKKGEGEQLIKKIFVQNVIENNNMLSRLLDDGSSCIILPRNAHDGHLYSNSLSRSQLKMKSRLSQGLGSREEALEASECLPSNDMLSRNPGIRNFSGFSSSKESSLSAYSGNEIPRSTCRLGNIGMSCSLGSQNAEGQKEDIFNGAGLLDQGLLSCVTCGILSFSCVAVIQPREAAAKYLMSADYSLLNEQFVGSGGTGVIDKCKNEGLISNISGESGKHVEDTADFDWIGYRKYSIQASDHSIEAVSDIDHVNGTSALDLLASAYGDLSDSDEEVLDENNVRTENDALSNNFSQQTNRVTESRNSYSSNNYSDSKLASMNAECQDRMSARVSQDVSNGPKGVRTRNKYQLKMVLSEGFHPKDIYSIGAKKEVALPSSSIKTMEEPVEVSGTDFGASCNHIGITTREHKSSDAKLKSSAALMVRSDKGLSRMHVFCLEHAIEVEKQLQPIGGVHTILLCHPEYPKIEAEAKLLAEEMGLDYDWKDVHFREADAEDTMRIQAALKDEEAMPTNSDWTVKLGINLYFSANLAKSPLYSKQMPYNRVIYRAFGCNSPNNSPVKLKASGRRPGRQKKIVLAGKWCGKAWMSNQVHPYLACRIECHEVEDMEGVCSPRLDQKPKADPDADHSSLVTPSKRKGSNRSATRKSSRKRKKKPLDQTDTKKPRRAQEDNSRTMKVVAETSSPCGRVLRSSSRNLKSQSQKKSIVKEEDDGPTTRSRTRSSKKEKDKVPAKKQNKKGKAEKTKAGRSSSVTKDDGEYMCDIEGCSMSFNTKQDLSLHKRDICPVKGCGKKFFSHKYLVQHRKVHMDDRPLECPWKGCNMTFKWPWARTEHIRVHTGDRPYVCREPGCGQTFRFVSDFSRHKRKTGHSAKKAKR